jgi:SAM-dependent methyltransferase
MVRKSKPNIDIFDQDAHNHGGYLYTKTTRLSSRLATQRSTDVILNMGCFAGRTVLDVGCGDGFYTFRMWDSGLPKRMISADAAFQAIKIAREGKADRPIAFVVADARLLPFPDDTFDLVVLQSILHHDDNPFGIIREAFRVAPEILIHEPNGNNPGLKVIEKTSRYHREHNEKSYSSRQLDRWVRHAGARVVRQQFAGFVPMFCPDWLARMMKVVEPVMEQLSLINALSCAVQVLIARRTDK